MNGEIIVPMSDEIAGVNGPEGKGASPPNSPHPRATTESCNIFYTLLLLVVLQCYSDTVLQTGVTLVKNVLLRINGMLS